MTSTISPQGSEPSVIKLAEYQTPAYLVTSVDLVFDLGEDAAEVTATCVFQRNRSVSADTPLVLDGQDQELLSVNLDGNDLSADAYQLTNDRLTLSPCKDTFQLTVRSRCVPANNTLLEGLYKSNGKFCTQCEAEGFRRITYFPDRPDVLATYITKIIADRDNYPVLLSNGNLVEEGSLEGGRHYRVWEDPFPKPCYLFALVAGKLKSVDDTFLTRSNKKVQLHVYVEEENIHKCGFAMESLKKAMRWDEEVYGLEYDLDVYNIVAVSDFNMGAMENKSLNIFNSKYVIADEKTGTDQDFEGIANVIAHEYFHNWTGNRVTCRDWFQLSLKEGLTVFRDQKFSEDLTSPLYHRIHQVNHLRASQFQEDAGPMAHPVRPESYIEINNFYTMTVYEKGAELVRMLVTIIGEDAYFRGIKLYFERFDGMAVTIEDFVSVMAEASGRDLTQFKLWYSQAGTPVVEVTEHHKPETGDYTLTFRQVLPETPDKVQKKPQLIPIKMALMSRTEKGKPLHDSVYLLQEYEQKFHFSGVREKPVASLLQNFSAPVILAWDRQLDELAFSAVYDVDGFNRYEAVSGLARRALATDEIGPREAYLEVFGQLLANSEEDPRNKSLLLSLPSPRYLANLAPIVDVEAIHRGLTEIGACIKQRYGKQLVEQYQRLALKSSRVDPHDSNAQGIRALRNLLLYYICVDEPSSSDLDLCRRHYFDSVSMTDSIGGLHAINHHDNALRQELFQNFYERWSSDTLVVDKWFGLQASARHPGVIQQVRDLLAHPAFDLLYPNRVYSIFGRFDNFYPEGFHQLSGEGYRILSEYVIRLDQKNPSVASRLVNSLSHWRRFDATRSALMKAELEVIIAQPKLSKDVFEIVSKSLAHD